MSILLPDVIAELRRFEAKATEGPWFIRPRPTDDGLSVIEDGRSDGLFPIAGETLEIELIVAMRNALPRLLDEIERLAAALTASRAEGERLAEDCARKEAAILLVRSIITDGAIVGFNPLDGDWADRLFASQHNTREALSPEGRKASLRASSEKHKAAIFPDATHQRARAENGGR